MISLTFSAYLSICKSYLMNNGTVGDFMLDFFAKIAVADGEDVDENCPFQKESDRRKAEKVFSGERALPKKDALFMKSHFNEDAFFRLFENLPEHMQQNLIDEIGKYGLKTDFQSLPKTMCDLFRDYIIGISEKKTSNDKDNSKRIKNDVPQEKLSNERNIHISSTAMTEAKRFCIAYEDNKQLFVLCQIARQIAPLHKHVRSMYTDYLNNSAETQDAIMGLCDIPVLKFETDWEDTYLTYFKEDIKKLHLVSKKDLLYEGGKYFHRAKLYPSIEVNGINTRIFPSAGICEDVNNLTGKRTNLVGFIDEYIYCRDNKIKNDITIITPFDWMIENLDLLNCSEDELTFWMCLFIYSACYIIPRDYGRKNVNDLVFTTPSFTYLSTLEDLYYATLLVLYDIYH